MKTMESPLSHQAAADSLPRVDKNDWPNLQRAIIKYLSARGIRASEIEAGKLRSPIGIYGMLTADADPCIDLTYNGRRGLVWLGDTISPALREVFRKLRGKNVTPIHADSIGDFLTQFITLME